MCVCRRKNVLFFFFVSSRERSDNISREGYIYTHTYARFTLFSSVLLGSFPIVVLRTKDVLSANNETAIGGGDFPRLCPTRRNLGIAKNKLLIII